MVVGDLGVVDKVLRFERTVSHKLLREGLIWIDHDRPQALRQGRHDVVGDIARIRARIGQQLVLLVELLRGGQRLFRREAKLRVGLALQRRQVVEQRRALRLVLVISCTVFFATFKTSPVFTSGSGALFGTS